VADARRHRGDPYLSPVSDFSNKTEFKLQLPKSPSASKSKLMQSQSCHEEAARLRDGKAEDEAAAPSD